MDPEDVNLITIDDSENPYIQASILAAWLEYKDVDAVSQMCRRRKDDFNDKEVVMDKSGNLWLDYNGALKICMFSSQEKARDARDEVINVYRAWRKGHLPSYEETSPAARAYNLARSVMALAEEQMKQEKVLKKHDESITSIDNRVKQIEAKQNKGFIAESQKAQITVKVRELGDLLSSVEGRSMYGTIYTSMYEEFGVSTYKNIPQDIFEEVMTWLEKKRSEIIKSME
jgi:hypothetical protein